MPPLFAEAIAHHQAGRLAEAEQLYLKAIKLAPRHADALRLLGGLYLQIEKPEQALPLLQQASQIQPANAEIVNHIGIALFKRGDNNKAAEYFKRAFAINPSYAEAYYNLGVVLQNDKNFLAARDYFEQALNYQPNYPDALNNLGNVFRELGEADSARSYLEQAIQLRPNYPEAYANKAALFYEEGKVSEALGHFEHALSYKPDLQSAQWGKALALLALGKYCEGWALHEKGLGNRPMPDFSAFPNLKAWDGQPAPDKHLLIWCEYGLGDSLQFIRYAALCKQKVGKISVLCPKPLMRLFGGLPYIDNAIETISEETQFDIHVGIFSLPHLFNTTLETIPATIPYLFIDPTVQASWKQRFTTTSSDMKVGLVWAGGIREGSTVLARVDQQRSLGLEVMKLLFDMQGVQFYNLQKDTPAGQIAELGLADCFIDYMDEVKDFADTAAIIQNLDLVITVDTSVAHLAGGLGKPVWILSRYNACWRWLQNRPASPWYPTARIFGQPQMGDWQSVMADVKRELEIVASMASLAEAS